jgi:3-ketosteroid 9alpha-monooxygenase subunit B
VSDHDPVLRQHGYHSLRVGAVVAETSEASSFVLEVPEELRATFRYRPGQFCTFRVSIDGEEHLRSYSMSSAPATDGERTATVTVKRVPGGLVSNALLDRVSEGDVLELTKPAGVFCPQETDRAVVALCGGSGITPVMSIAKHVLATTERSVRLLYANRERSTIIFEDALAGLCEGYGSRLEVRHHVDAEGGFLSTAEIAGFVGRAVDTDFYVCGPGPFMELVESTLQRMGVAQERIFVERFLVEQQEKDAAWTRPGAARGEEVPEAVTVKLGGRTESIAYQPGDTLLETARRGGLRPPFSCESGNCATCMAFLKEGAATMRVNNALTSEEVDEGWILTCQGVPRGRVVTVEYEPM